MSVIWWNVSLFRFVLPQVEIQLMHFCGSATSDDEFLMPYIRRHMPSISLIIVDTKFDHFVKMMAASFFLLKVLFCLLN